MKLRGDAIWSLEQLLREYPCLDKYCHHFPFDSEEYIAYYYISEDKTRILIDISINDKIDECFIIDFDSKQLLNVSKIVLKPLESLIYVECYSFGNVFIYVTTNFKMYRCVMVGAKIYSQKFYVENHTKQHVAILHLKAKLMKLVG